MLYGHYLGEIRGVLSGLLRGIVGVQTIAHMLLRRFGAGQKVCYQLVGDISAHRGPLYMSKG